MVTPIDVRRAGDRLHTRIDWLDSWHSFSFGHHYVPSNVSHGLLLVHNDDRIAAGRGFGEHAHRDMEIVTWVIEGGLEHRDSAGNEGHIVPGLAQRMSAGTGIRHSEMNASAHEAARFIQMWVPPDTTGVAPGYEQQDVSAELAGGGLVTVAAGDGSGAVHINQRDATLYVARLAAGASVEVPASPHGHVFVATGTSDLDGAGPLSEGDAVRLTGAGARRLIAGPDGAEVIVWATA